MVTSGLSFLFWAYFVILVSHGFCYAVGIAVAYTARTKHGCMKVVENNYCASKRGMLSLPLSGLILLVAYVV